MPVCVHLVHFTNHLLTITGSTVPYEEWTFDSIIGKEGLSLFCPESAFDKSRIFIAFGRVTLTVIIMQVTWIYSWAWSWDFCFKEFNSEWTATWSVYKLVYAYPFVLKFSMFVCMCMLYVCVCVCVMKVRTGNSCVRIEVAITLNDQVNVYWIIYWISGHSGNRLLHILSFFVQWGSLFYNKDQLVDGLHVHL